MVYLPLILVVLRLDPTTSENNLTNRIYFFTKVVANFPPVICGAILANLLNLIFGRIRVKLRHQRRDVTESTRPVQDLNLAVQIGFKTVRFWRSKIQFAAQKFEFLDCMLLVQSMKWIRIKIILGWLF